MDVVLPILIVLVVLAILAGSSVRPVQQYQRGVVLRLGRLQSAVREPGLRVIIPFVDRMTRVSVQTVVLDIPKQGAITRDNVTVDVDAVVYFRVDDPVKAVINIQDYVQATSTVAQTSLRSVIGRAELDTLLSDREKINSELRDVIDAPTEEWGITIDRVEVKDISLPETMRRSMSAQAEAERERRARVISADGEFQASTKLARPRHGRHTRRDAAPAAADRADVPPRRTAPSSCRSPSSCCASSSTPQARRPSPESGPRPSPSPRRSPPTRRPSLRGHRRRRSRLRCR